MSYGIQTSVPFPSCEIRMDMVYLSQQIGICRGVIVKKKFIIAATVVLAIFLIYFLGSGFLKNGSVYIGKYSVSENGKEITLDIGVAASAGYIRKAVVHQQEGGKLYIDCYSAFGGINGSIAAKSEFVFPLAEDTTTIGIYRNENCYEEILHKDANGIWQRIE